MTTNKITYHLGLPEQLREAAVNLYYDAFGKKIAVAIKSETSRHQLIKNGFMLEFAIVAISQNKLVGIAGFHTPKGSLTGGITYKSLLTQLGLIKGNWAALIFSLFERKPKLDELVMDGIAVQTDARGKGVGSKLLDEISKYARKKGFKTIRLDVIDINPKAKKLYQRKGFKSVRVENFPYLRWLLGFSGSTTMELNLDNNLTGF